MDGDTNTQSNANSTLFIGNLPYAVREPQLKAFLAEKLGTIELAEDQERYKAVFVPLFTDKFGNEKSRGIAFVSLKNASDVEEAINKLNGQEMSMDGSEPRAINVSLKKPSERREGGSYNRDGGRRFGGDRGGDRRGGGYGRRDSYGNDGFSNDGF